MVGVGVVSLDRACPTCRSPAGEHCKSASGVVQGVSHARRRHETRVKPRDTVATKLRKLQDRINRAERALAEAKATLSAERAEVRRLKRLLHNSDAGVIAGLRQQLSDAQAQIKRLKAELLS